jgi:hypothetical protein
MKIFTFICCLLTAQVVAQPINYQGRLSDKSGTNVNGTKNFALRIFDAKTGGKQIYEENIGAVAVNEGAYSFNFGETGKSVVTPTETIAFADGEKQIFNYTAKNPPVLGEIKISGGGYSWTEAGSSDATKFTATANKNSGAVSAIFLTGAPETGQEISIAYDHNSDGVMGALSRGGQAWLELVVGGETLSPRERLVAVPFALRAGVADEVINKAKQVLYYRDLGFLAQGPANSIFDNQLWSRYLKNSGNESQKFYIPEKTNGLILKVDMQVLNIRYAKGKWIVVKPEDYEHPIRFKINDSEGFLTRGETEVKFENINSGWAELTVHFEPPANYQWEITGYCSLVVLGY